MGYLIGGIHDLLFQVKDYTYVLVYNDWCVSFRFYAGWKTSVVRITKMFQRNAEYIPFQYHVLK